MSDSRTSSNAGVLLGLAALALLSVGGVVLAFLRTVNHDVALYIYSAMELLRGAKLHHDIVELNPPLIIFLNLPAAMLARATGIEGVTAFRLFTLMLAAASGGLVLRALATGVGRATVVWIGALLAYLFLLLPAENFGQRDHLLVMLVAPWVVHVWCRGGAGDVERTRSPTWWRRVLPVMPGALAAAGFGLKPQYGIVALALIAQQIVRRRSLRAIATVENVALFVGLAVYGLYLVTLSRAYLTTIAPLVVKTYGAFDATTLYMLTHPAWVSVLLAGGAALLLLRLESSAIADSKRHRSGGHDRDADAAIPAVANARSGGEHVELPALAVALLLALAGFLAVAFAQHKGWDYHFVPTLTAAHALIALAAWRVIRAEGHWARWGVLACVPLLAAYALPVVRNLPYPDAGTQLAQYLRQNARGERVAVLSTALSPQFPAITLAEVRSSLRLAHLWPLPWHYRDTPAGQSATYHPPEKMEPSERFVFDATISDLVARPPALLLIDAGRTKAAFGDVRFDYVAYFSQDARFKQLMERYSRGGNFGQFQVYTLGRAGAAGKPGE